MRDHLPDIFIWTAIAALGLSVLRLLYEPSVGKLHEEISGLRRESSVIAENIKNVFDGYLYQLSKKLEFGVNGENMERVTIYIHNSNGSFIPFGRYSANPAFRGPGRSEYPDTQGCISHGWRNGWHFDNSLGTDRTYNRINADRYAMPEAVTSALNMKSHLYGVKRIDDGNGQHLAVIVVESTRENRYTLQQLKDILDDEEGVISELITKLRPHIPELSFARSRGF